MAKMKLSGKQAAVLGAAAVATGAVIVAKRKHRTPVDNAIPEEMPSPSDLDTQTWREEPPQPGIETSATQPSS